MRIVKSNKSVEASARITKELKNEIFEELEAAGGYFNYDRAVDELMSDYSLSKKDAESIVWQFTTRNNVECCGDVKASSNTSDYKQCLKDTLVARGGYKKSDVEDQSTATLESWAKDAGIDVDNICACGDVSASTTLSANEQALKHIKAAIDILGKSGNKDAITKDTIANLGVVMLDLKGGK